MRPRLLIPSLLCAALAQARAQSLSRQVKDASGPVAVIYPTKPSVCGDGRGSISNVFGHFESSSRVCLHTPARLVLTVVGGEITRARMYVGPLSPLESNVRTINATAKDAESWLSDLVEHANTRVAADLLLPLIVVDGSEPWKLLLRLVRDENRPREFKRSAMLWLSNEVSDHLGILDSGDQNDDDELRSQAVFVLTQRPKSEGIPALIDVVRTAAHPSARRAAIYWLGQSDDPRAVDVYAELLGLK